MKIKLLSLLMAAMLFLGILAGCAQQNTTESTAGNTAAQSTTLAAGETTQTDNSTATAEATKENAVKYPLVLTDASGTQVTINSKPAKIVCLPLGACEMLLSIADKSEIAAMTHYVDDPIVSNIADEVKGVGQRLDFNAEKILALQPDLVIVDTWQDANIVKQLRDAKINVFVSIVPANVDQQKEILKLLGNITDNKAKADQVINWMDTKLKAVSDKLSGLKEEQKLTIIDYSEMTTTSGKGTNFDDVVTRAGLINPVSKEGITGWPQLSKEMIVKYNPDLICLPSWYYDNKVSFKSLSEAIFGDKSLAGVKAVKNKRLVSVPHNHISTTSQYAVLAVEDLAKAAYPELFK